MDIREAAIAKPELKRQWIPTRSAFQHLLTWLDEGHDSDGAKYLEMRRRLVWYFDRKRCLAPDDLADETLNRVARRLEEQGTITDAAPARYCYIVAKFVFLEHQRQNEYRQSSVNGSHDWRSEFAAPAGSEADAADRERLLDCLDRCLRQLAADDRELILEYYRGAQRAKIEHRRHLAERLHVTANALSIRACRIRGRLEACVSACRAARDISCRESSHQE